MKKRVIFIAILILVTALLSGCNYSIVDTTYSFEEAIIRLPDGEIIKGKVQSWLDFEDGDQIQVKIGGKTYLTHMENVALISK